MFWQIFTRGPEVLSLFTLDDKTAAVVCVSDSYCCFPGSGHEHLHGTFSAVCTLFYIHVLGKGEK